MVKPTPTPWKHVAYAGGWDGIASAEHESGVLICKLVENNSANAAFIVRACNAHDDLVKACKDAAELFEDDEGIAQVLLAAISKATESTP